MDKTEKSPVTKEQVTEWVRRDITAASYFLSLLIRYPDIISSVADQLYDRVMKEENGSLIDHQKQENNGVS